MFSWAVIFLIISIAAAVLRSGGESLMKGVGTPKQRQEGKIGYILLWLLGIPIPILLLIFLLRGCN